MKVFGMIPARGGSKGVPRKNIRLVGGQPLIQYAIDAARESQLLTDFVVSTDDAEIGAVSQKGGATVLMRPPHLAEDKTPMLPVIQHALQQAMDANGAYDFMVLLQPTAPLRTGADVDGALQLLADTGADSVVSVYQVEDAHPARMYTIDEGRLVAYDKEPKGRLRQALPAVYHRNGAIYACRTELLLQDGRLIGNDLRPFVMPRVRSFNIDDPLDLHIADFVLQNRAMLEAL